MPISNTEKFKDKKISLKTESEGCKNKKFNGNGGKIYSLREFKLKIRL